MERLFKGLFALAIFLAANDIGGWGIVPKGQINSTEWPNIFLSSVFRIVKKQTGVYFMDDSLPN
jgi:hypothetical protein